MAKKRRGPRCRICCGPPECSINVIGIVGDGLGGVIYRVAVYYNNIDDGEATLTGYDGADFVYPEFNGIVEVEAANVCSYQRLILQVRSVAGTLKECVWVNPNCCCVESPATPCDKYRLPLSRGGTGDQPGVFVTISGVTMSPTWTVACPDYTGFFNGTFFVPFGSRYLASSSFTCNYGGLYNVNGLMSLNIGWGYSYTCYTDFAEEGPDFCTNWTGTYPKTYRHFTLSIVGDSTIPTFFGTTSQFRISAQTKAYQVEDYLYLCNPYKPDCAALSLRTNCIFPPKAPVPVGPLNCADFPRGGSCCYPGNVCLNCSAQCGGVHWFSDVSVAVAEA